ncbi:velvet factor-domain-containing protein [Cladorrhinum sp. PSN259]|nr:velvet factor-domain-containing protein [Cladorrhinum sp. PSN259]
MMAQAVPQDYELLIRQEPRNGCVALTKGKDRRPLDPPPIVQLKISNRVDPIQKFLQNPYLILVARLVPKSSNDDSDDKQRQDLKTGDLAGTVVSSLYNLKDLDNQQGGFFVFGDLSVKKEGTFRLEFILFELRTATRECWQLSSQISKEFTVYASKNFPGLSESTFLTRTFSDQGVRLRLRKDSRTVISRKRTASNAQQIDQMKVQSMGGYMHHDNGAHELSPNGQSPHHPRRPSNLDSPYDNSYEFSYDRPHKRMRQHSTSEHPGYDNGYSSYANPSPRTMPEPLVSYPGPMTTGYQIPTQPAVSGLPMPGGMPFTSLGRLDTQLPPHTAGPNSASSTFSPGTRRSPGAAYPYPPQQGPPPIHMSPIGLYNQASYMNQHADTGPLSHSSNLSNLDLENVGKP